MSEITQEQIEEWKAKHGEIYCIEVAEEPIDFESDIISTKIEDDQAVAKGYLKKPDTKTQSFAYAKMQDSPVAGGEAILKQCWLGGDERLLNSPSYKTAAALKAMSLAEIRIGRIKKL